MRTGERPDFDSFWRTQSEMRIVLDGRELLRDEERRATARLAFGYAPQNSFEVATIKDRTIFVTTSAFRLAPRRPTRAEVAEAARRCAQDRVRRRDARQRRRQAEEQRRIRAACRAMQRAQRRAQTPADVGWFEDDPKDGDEDFHSRLCAGFGMMRRNHI